MKFSELIFKMNSHNNMFKSKDIQIIKGRIIVTVDKRKLDNETICDICVKANYINEKYKMMFIPIVFFMPRIDLVDKLSYVLLECIAYTLMQEFGRVIEFSFNVTTNIITEGFKYSPLWKITNGSMNYKKKKEEYLSKFSFSVYKYHYRRLLKYEESDGNDKLSKVYDELVYFQKHCAINSNVREEIAEVAIELIGNAIEHSTSDCLIDFDIATNYKNSQGESVNSLNLAIVNYSENLLADKLTKAIKTYNPSTDLNNRYKKVLEAYNNHSRFFNEQYGEEDFFNISTFQNRVSSRQNNLMTGGTGLTKLLKSVEDKSENHACYVLTGNRIIILDKDYLEYEGDWIGFNKEHDYFNTQPNLNLIQRSKFYMPGTAYNLNFIMKVGDENE